ncbi:uncharacterized protein BO97DRAFT_455060 [Aspergillus homomorphus CBS 101889]|uniref:Uncharacterized protein n=1 Tax=Aspergillus homomorphus (strain CBS 101889) TaxID=1450537 RepID=A0A395HTD5_ASPHC|nr:hypothetical protein BO97DRAFT_455060 [Aspergillus homomorphus CBS 101889]RAL10673.1 hypothetical protein BO97DRAFT_455060 [Aspergillus homomorphus CBS 101889]
MPVARPPPKNAHKHLSAPYPSANPASNQHAQAVVPESTGDNLRSGSHVNEKAQGHVSQTAARSWVAAAREILKAGDTAQKQEYGEQAAHQTQIQHIHLKLENLALETKELVTSLDQLTRDIKRQRAKLERLCKDLKMANTEISPKTYNAVWKAYRAAVYALLDAHKDDEEGCAMVKKELEALDDVHH